MIFKETIYSENFKNRNFEKIEKVDLLKKWKNQKQEKNRKKQI